MANAPLRGILPVIEVPFTSDERIDHDGFRVTIAKQVAAGVDGVMFPGFASEFHKLAGDERRSLTSTLISDLQAAGGAHGPAPRAIVSVADHATSVAVREAAWAVEMGADAINLLPPFLFGPSPEAIDTHIRAVLDVVAPVPVVLQHAPAQTGGALTSARVAAIASEHENLRTIKVESQPPGRLVAALTRSDPPLHTLVGYAGLHAIEAYERGAVGIQPGCSFPELYVELDRRWRADDHAGARALHRLMLPYLSAWMQHVELIVAVEKVISVERGWFASSTVRAPGWDIDAAERALIDRFLEEFRGWLEG